MHSKRGALLLTLLLSAPALLLAQCPTYTVQSGDTFSSIAAAKGTTASALQAANPSVSATSLQVGQKINLPCSGSSTPSSPSTTPAASTGSDAPYSISAQQFSQALTANGFPTQPDSVRTDMLAAIQKLGGSSVISSNRELAMFLAQAELETGGLQKLTESGAGTDPPFVGRGYLMLTHQNNYAAASQAIVGDNTLVNTPTLVASSPYAWETAAWYWKTSVHSAPGVQSGQFGASTNAINGALECHGSNPSAQTRCSYYTKILPILSPSSTVDCSGCGS